MSSETQDDQKVDVNFESHPPIEADLTGVSTLLRQSLLQFVDCHSLASYLIGLKDVTQVIAQESNEEEEGDETSDGDVDDNIYGVISAVDLTSTASSSQDESNVLKQLCTFLGDHCPKIKELISDEGAKLGLIINERYINLPPQLSVPTFKALAPTLDNLKLTHLVFISKILVKARSSSTKLPSKRAKSTPDEPLVFVNAEEEIIFERCEHHSDLDVSAHCDENATWSFGSDIKYIPHRRIFVIDYKNWPDIMQSLEKELELGQGGAAMS